MDWNDASEVGPASPAAHVGLDPERAIRQPWQSNLIAVGLVAAAGALRLWPLGDLESRLAWLTFYPSVAIAALVGGLSSGLLATVLASLSVLVILPALGHQPFIRDSVDWLGVSVFFATCMVISGVAESMLRSNARAKKAKAAADASSKELEAFSYAVAHDLRAPLRSIDGFSQAILEDSAGQLDADSKAHLERVRAAAQRMAQLIDDLLALSQVSRGELHRESVDLSLLARTVGNRLREAHGSERAVELVIEDGMRASGDARLLTIVMENLLGNAWKFTRKRAVARIEVASVSRDGRSPYFVRDDGAGFDMAYAGRLFGAFQRLHSPTEFPGTGIGLATVRRVIHRHRGRVWAESQVDQGTTIYFTLG